MALLVTVIMWQARLLAKTADVYVTNSSVFRGRLSPAEPAALKAAATSGDPKQPKQ